MSCSCGIQSKDECKAMQYAVIVKEAEDFEYAKVYRLRVDTYCLQHPDIHLISSKSFFAHLLGMCIAIEYNNDPNLIKAIGKWGYGKNKLEKPPMLEYYGDLTILHIINAKNGFEYGELVKEWANSVWNSYIIYHELAHSWLEKVKEEYYN